MITDFSKTNVFVIGQFERDVFGSNLAYTCWDTCYPTLDEAMEAINEERAEQMTSNDLPEALDWEHWSRRHYAKCNVYRTEFTITQVNLGRLAT